MRIINFKKLIMILGVVSLAILTSCLNDNDYEDQGSIDDRLIQAYLKKNKIDAKKSAKGFYYTVIKANSSGEKVKVKDILSVYYKINLLNGNEVGEVKESSGKPKKFKVVDKSIIPMGIRMGSRLMREGEKYKFYLPSNLTYGVHSYKSLIPSNSIFIVETHIVKIDKEAEQKQVEKTEIEAYITAKKITDITEKDSGIFYKKIENGTGDLPVNGKTVKIKYIVKYLNGTELDKTGVNKTFDFKLGSKNVIKGVQEGVKLMKKGEKATLIIPSHLAYDSSLQIFPEEARESLIKRRVIAKKVPPFSNLIFEVELVDFN